MSNTAPPQTLHSARDQYEIKRQLGQGGFGVTYLAHAQRTQEEVVLKLLKPERLESWKAVELFEREAEVLQRLNHPHIPRFIDHFEHADEATGALLGLALVQSYVEGQTLRARAKHAQIELLQDWLIQLLHICDYLHTLSPPVVHRDLNPSNILIRDEDDSAVVIDFGTVQAAFRDAQEISSTSAGTFGYAPMEQLVGRASYASDLYALGVTFVVALCGQEPHKLPFDGARLDVQGAIKSVHAQVPPALARALVQMTEPDPSARPKSARALIDALSQPSISRPNRASRAHTREDETPEPRLTRPVDDAPAADTLARGLTLYAPHDGSWELPLVQWDVSVNQRVKANQRLGTISGIEVEAPAAGIVCWRMPATPGFAPEAGARLIVLDLDPADAAAKHLDQPESTRVEPITLFTPQQSHAARPMYRWQVKVGQLVRAQEVLAIDVFDRAPPLVAPRDAVVLQLYIQHTHFDPGIAAARLQPVSINALVSAPPKYLEPKRQDLLAPAERVNANKVAVVIFVLVAIPMIFVLVLVLGVFLA